MPKNTLHRTIARKSIFLFSTLLAFALNAPIAARDGDLDNSFSNDGIVTYEFQASVSAPLNVPVANAIQSDGKIVFAGMGMIPVTGGSTDGYIVIRYNPDGSYDTTFGSGGIVRTSVGNFELVGGLIIQPDGKIVVSGERYSGANATDFVLVRYNTDGTLDNSFDGNGVAVANVVGISEERGGAAALQPDGKIVVVGQTDNQTNNSSFDWAIVRFNSDGSLDTTFDSDGKVVLSLGGDSERANSVAVQSDGKIVISGVASNGANNDFITVRLTANGSIDQSFGNQGVVRTQFGNSNEFANSVKIQSDNKIVVAGGSYNGTNFDIALARYSNDGSLDSSFGLSGLITTSYSPTSSEVAYSIALQQSGKIVVSSKFGNNAGVVRFNNDGRLDISFGTNGKVSNEIIGFTTAYPYSLAIQDDGKIVASGVANWLSSQGPNYFFTARYSGVSSTKTLFDYDGDGKSDISVFRQSTGNWFIVNSSNNSFLAAQFGVSDDLITPADFDNDGKSDIAVFRPSTGIWYWLNSSNNSFSAIQFGTNGDLPAPADFDGDGRADVAVYRPSAGAWYRSNSSNGQFIANQFGIAEDKPALGDFDGDGKADISVFRPSNGSWYRLNSSNNQFVAAQFGLSEDKVVPADYDGDGKTDIAVYRPSTGGWYRVNSSNGQFVAAQFGIAEDLPAPADFDGDGKADLGVFRPSNGSWYLSRSTQGFAAAQFGTGGDIPTPNAFVK